MKKIPCNVIRDLLPSYVDKICSEESKGLVEEHVKECSDCSEYLSRISTETDALKVCSNKDFDYMKKIRRHVDIRSLILMAFILITTVTFSSYSMRHGSQTIVFFILMPLVMICNYFMFFQLKPVRKEKERVLSYLLGGIELATTVFMFLLMNYLVPQWIERGVAHQRLPFGLELRELGPFVFWLLTCSVLVAIIVWFTTILLHMKGKAFHMMISCSSLVIIYCCIYYRYLLKTLTDVDCFHELCNQAFYLLAEGVLVVLVLKLLERYRTRNIS